MPGYKPEHRIAVLLFLLCYFTYGYFFQSGQHNENARFDQVRAIVEDGTFSINKYAANTADVIVYEGKVYPNKAPGLTFVSVPLWYLASRALGFMGFSSPALENFVCYLVAWHTTGLASAILAATLFLVLYRILGRLSAALLLTWAYQFGTIAFPFSTLYFSHQFSAALAFVAFGMIFLQDRIVSPGRRLIALLSSGACLGVAVASEYPVALIGLPLTAYALLRLRLSRAFLAFCLGGLLGVAMLLSYNLLAFGQLYFIPYSVYATEARVFAEHGKGYMGVGMPTLKALYEITFGLQRGLFVVNPWLVLLIPAVLGPLLERRHRSALLLSLLIVVSFFVFNAGYGDSIVFWGGGASVGPRHIIPMLPFAIVLMAPLLRLRFLSLAVFPLVTASSLLMLVATAVEPRVPYEYGNPLKDLFWRGYLRSDFASFHEGVFGSVPLTDTTVAFNHGKLIGLPEPVQLWPLLLAATASTVWLARFALARDRGGSIGALGRWQGRIAWLVVLVFALVPVAARFRDEVLHLGSHGLMASYIRGAAWDRLDVAFEPTWVEPERMIRVAADEQVFRPDDSWRPTEEQRISVEWVGYLLIEQDGVHTFATESDDGSAIYLDGSLLLDNWGVHSRRVSRTTKQLERGLHPIAVRYYNEGFGGMMALLWAEPVGHLRVIPRRNLLLTKSVGG